MKRALIAVAVLAALACTSRAQIATINETWVLGQHPPSQQACTMPHSNCTVTFSTDGVMQNYEWYNGGPRINWRPGQTVGWHFAGITGLQSVTDLDGMITETYSFSDLIAYDNNVMVGYASGTYVLTIYWHETGCSRSGCWFVWSPFQAQLNATVTAQPQ